MNEGRPRCPRTTKHQYATEADAKLMAGFIPAKWPRNRNATALRAYLCPFCKMWHLTHQPYQPKKGKG